VLFKMLSSGLSWDFPVMALQDTSADTLKQRFFFYVFCNTYIVITYFHCLCVFFEAMKLLISDFLVILCHWECNIQSQDCASMKY